jgi:uncharacterized Zn finger protein
MSWQQWETARPRRVEGGIKAKSKRGAIGSQWWSRRFIGALESYGMSGRLARGRSYARAGQVIEFALAKGKVTAKVQGSRVKPYEVRLGVTPLSAGQWDRVCERLASAALFRAKLLAGEMPHEIEEVFADCGTPLFPEDVDDLDMRCNCPDWEVPCKHLAAVCYVLAEAFDADPFAMLAWRGKGRDDLLAALRSTVTEAPAAVPEVPARPLSECMDSFYTPGLSLARLRSLSSAPAYGAPDLLLRMFEPPPVVVRNKDLGAILTLAYQSLATSDEADPQLFSRCPDLAHGLGQAPPAELGEPVVGVDRAEHLP